MRHAGPDKICSNSRIRKHILEEMVLREIENNIFSDQVLASVRHKLIAFLGEYQEDRQNELNCLNKDLSQVDRSINQLLARIAEIEPKALLLLWTGKFYTIT